MRGFFFFLGSVFLELTSSLFFQGFSALGASSVPELVVYTASSLMTPEGLGPVLFSQFEKQSGCRVRVLTYGNGAQLLARLQLDAHRDKRNAHVLLGVDQHLWERVKPWTESWGDWTPRDYSQISVGVSLERGILPYNYGIFAFMVDRQYLNYFNLKEPSSLLDLLQIQWRRNILMEDPRTSSVGLSFLVYTQAVLGGSVWNFWKNFRNQWLTLTPSWDGAYRLFLKKEAPLVWSYLSSQAYHEEMNSLGSVQSRYQAIIWKEGNPLQIEGAVFLKGIQKSQVSIDLGRKFLEFLISKEVQSLIPRKMWMMPVRQDIDLPLSFKKLPKPFRVFALFPKPVEIKESLAQWNRVVVQ